MTQEFSAVDLPPPIDTSDQPLPGPAQRTLRPTPPARLPPKDRPDNALLAARRQQKRAVLTQLSGLVIGLLGGCLHAGDVGGEQVVWRRVVEIAAGAVVVLGNGGWRGGGRICASRSGTPAS